MMLSTTIKEMEIDVNLYLGMEVYASDNIDRLIMDGAIITLNSAFYYYGLTDTIPDFYYVATTKNTRKISDERVKQFYENSEAFDMGKTTMNYDGVDIVIYDKERLLVELIRNKRKFSFDLYKELIASYRKIVHELDMTLVAEYAYELPKSNMVMETLRLEVL